MLKQKNPLNGYIIFSIFEHFEFILCKKCKGKISIFVYHKILIHSKRTLNTFGIFF